MPRILIVAEHASMAFGGEASLPLHYFRVLRQRGLPVWLLVHERTRSELQAQFGPTPDIVYVRDTWAHRLLWQLGRPLPARLSYFSTGLLLRLITQTRQRSLAKEMIARLGIDVVHQPIPVSPKEPSLLFNLGAPVLIGPMNGGMNYPPAFQSSQSRWVERLINLGRRSSALVNRLLPGKHRARFLLVANERTRQALPSTQGPKVVQLVENGVDLALWRRSPIVSTESDTTQFVFVGRLVDWKAVDLLLQAFDLAANRHPMALTILGDGPMRDVLQSQAKASRRLADPAVPFPAAGRVRFAGWMRQNDCAQALQCADAMVLPSLMECGGAVVLEAMACGLPVIATDWGGPADYLDPSCGILVPPTSRDAFITGLCEAMVRLAGDPVLRQTMGRAGRAKVEREFDWETKVDRMLELYELACTEGNLRHSPPDIPELQQAHRK